MDVEDEKMGTVSLDKSKQLASKLKNIRQFNKLGSLDKFSKGLNVNKNTIGAYERGERLPDVDYLCIFAKNTGANFFDLLMSRLKSSSREEARAMSKEVLEKCSNNQTEEKTNQSSSSSTTTSSSEVITEEPTINNHSNTLNETVKLLTANYNGSSKTDKDLVITMLLKQLQFSNSINQYAVEQIIHTLKALDDKEERVNTGGEK